MENTTSVTTESTSNAIINSLEDYLNAFSYPELKRSESADIDEDFKSAVSSLVSIYATFGSMNDFIKFIDTKMGVLAKDKMLEAAKDNFNCI